MILGSLLLPPQHRYIKLYQCQNQFIKGRCSTLNTQIFDWNQINIWLSAPNCARLNRGERTRESGVDMSEQARVFSAVGSNGSMLYLSVPWWMVVFVQYAKYGGGERCEKIIDKWSQRKLRWSNQHSANLKGCKQCLPSEYILLMRKVNTFTTWQAIIYCHLTLARLCVVEI